MTDSLSRLRAGLDRDEAIARGDGGCYHGPDCLECNGWPPIETDPEDTE